MSLYPESVARCHQIKVNGTQCGSPALRAEKFCYFHMRWQSSSMSVILKKRERWIAGLPTLEDANSIQVGLAEVMRLLVTQEVDHKTGALLLYAMQTAASNMRRTSFEPEPTRMVIDRECVERRPLGATAWSRVAGREYDDMAESVTKPVEPVEQVVLDEASPEFAPDSMLMYLYGRRKLYEPEHREERIENVLARRKKLASTQPVGPDRTVAGTPT